MKKSMAACAILAALGVFSSTVFAEERQWDDMSKSTMTVSPTIVRSSAVSMHIEDANDITGNLGPNQLLFTIKINASADAKIAMGTPGWAGRETALRAGGVLVTSGETGSQLVGIIDEEYRDALTRDSAYFFTGTTQADSLSEILLLEGQDQYAINVVTRDKQSVDDYIRPGNYTFNLLAQAYTE
ncbi:hypothetical protein RJE46_08705 [Cedecea neteri]|uniref:hypothetical protein n=1 Tax=Cedecea neteri TaxID=158822 RepID=UPI00155DFB38|nr:hypothetical protein [Cedecea neteri]NIG76611.1 hypothetical protein [Klebsiella sp. Ap-873]WNJ81291.1 hypothetical protein RJE46_08705 [Cedecea neteri]